MRRVLDTVKRVVLNKVFSRLLAGYFALTLVIAALCVTSYSVAFRLSKQYAIERNMLLFEGAAASINSAYDIIDQFTLELSELVQYRELLSAAGDDDSERTIKVYEATRTLPSIKDESHLLAGYYVYCAGYDAIIAPGQGFVNLQNYYDTYFSIDPQHTYEQWREAVLNCTARSLMGTWKVNSMILDVVPLRRPLAGGSSSRVIFRIDNTALLDQISVGNSNGLECAAISDMNGNILSISNRSEEIADLLSQCDMPGDSGTITVSSGKTEYLLTYAMIEKMGARLMLLQPMSILHRDAADSIHGLLEVMAWFLIIGFVLIGLLLLSNVIPLLKIAESASNMSISSRGMQAISDVYTHMEESNVSLKQNLDEYRRNLRTACINRLIHGGGSDPYSLDAMVDNSDLSIEGSSFHGVLVEMHLEENETAQLSEMARTVISEVINQHPRLMFLQLERLNVIAYLYSCEDGDPDNPCEELAPLYETVRTRFGIETTFYVGSQCTDLEALPVSFASARWLMQTARHDQWLYIDLDDREHMALIELFPADEEKKLLNNIVTGDWETSRHILDEMYQRCFVRSNTRGFARQYLYCRMIGLLARCSTDMERLPDSLLQMDSNAFFEWISEKFERCCEENCSRSTRRSQRIAEDVRQYIEENYADANMSLNVLAFHFGMTANYLSGMFKKMFDMNFSAFLEQVRMRHAQQLLNDTALSVDDVALRTGYTNSDSFRRAFKRTFGVNPSQFRSSVHPTE